MVGTDDGVCFPVTKGCAGFNLIRSLGGIHAIEDDVNARIGAITAFAILAFAGDLLGFKNGCEFPGWLGLTPKEHSTGDRYWTGSIAKIGQRDVRSLLVNGAMAVLQQTGRRPKELMSPWLRHMCDSKPSTVVAVALANRMARVVWVVVAKQSN